MINKDNKVNEIWVIADHFDEKPATVTFELLGKARDLADRLKTNVSLVVLGYAINHSFNDFITRGADSVLAVEDQSLAQFHNEKFTDIITELISQHQPELVLLSANTYGCSLAPRIAARLGTGLTADCTRLDIDKDTGMIIQTRPAFNGNLLASIVSRKKPQMATIRPGIMEMMNIDKTRSGKVIRSNIKITEKKGIEILDVFQIQDKDIFDTNVIIGIGKGINKRENIPVFEKLAKSFGAQLGASRDVIEAGWIDFSRQIGQSGKIVKPDYYFAFGISGAVQHLVGINGAKTVIAINKDPEAPIFKVANYGLVGDAVEIAEELLGKLESGELKL